MIIFIYRLCFYFFSGTASRDIYSLSLHDALPIFLQAVEYARQRFLILCPPVQLGEHLIRVINRSNRLVRARVRPADYSDRSEEHTSELQSRQYLVCRLLLEKKKHRRRPKNL